MNKQIGKHVSRRNGVIAVLYTTVFMVVFWMYVGIFSDASESKCLRANCDNLQAVGSVYCCEHGPHSER